MKKMILMVFAIGSVCASTQETQNATLGKPALTGKRAVYALQYKALRKSLLGKPAEEMGTAEALEAIAVEFSLAIEKADARLAQLEQRTKALEDEAKETRKWQEEAGAFIDKLDKRVKTLEDKMAVVEGDQAKLFNWERDTDDELRYGFHVNGVKSSLRNKVEQLDQQINNFWQGLSGRVGNLEKAVDNHAAVINDIANALRSLR